MKRLFYFLAFVLMIPVLTSCDFYCTWSVVKGVRDAFSGKGWDPDGGIKSVNYVRKECDDFIKIEKEYKLYLVTVQQDTIYWFENDAYQQKSILNGYTFESNNQYISGPWLTLDATYEGKLRINLSENTSDEYRVAEVVLFPNYYQIDGPYPPYGTSEIIEITQSNKDHK